MTRHRDLFTRRKLLALKTFTDLVAEARERIRKDGEGAGLRDDNLQPYQGGAGANGYADAVSVYLAFVISKLLDYHCALIGWYPAEGTTSHRFTNPATAAALDVVG